MIKQFVTEDIHIENTDYIIGVESTSNQHIVAEELKLLLQLVTSLTSFSANDRMQLLNISMAEIFPSSARFLSINGPAVEMSKYVAYE